MQQYRITYEFDKERSQKRNVPNSQILYVNQKSFSAVCRYACNHLVRLIEMNKDNNTKIREIAKYSEEKNEYIPIIELKEFIESFEKP